MSDKCSMCGVSVPKAGSPVFRGFMFAAPISAALWLGIIAIMWL